MCFTLGFGDVGGHLAPEHKKCLGALAFTLIAFAGILKGVNSYDHERLLVFPSVSKFFLKQDLKLLGF